MQPPNVKCMIPINFIQMSHIITSVFVRFKPVTLTRLLCNLVRVTICVKSNYLCKATNIVWSKTTMSNSSQFNPIIRYVCYSCRRAEKQMHVRLGCSFQGCGRMGCSGSPKTDIIADVIHWPEHWRSLPDGSQTLKKDRWSFLEGLRGRECWPCS